MYACVQKENMNSGNVYMIFIESAILESKEKVWWPRDKNHILTPDVESSVNGNSFLENMI